MANVKSEMSNNNIIVSICCITYNHARFVRETMEGFLMQEPPTCMPKDAKLSDWCEILIHDDASTDGTDTIVREYADKYPDLIHPLYEEENQYSRGGAGRMAVLFNYKRAKGKYIAYCEGDDYWTDSKKLQKQVDWMEAHEEYSVCFHKFKNYNYKTDEYDERMYPTLLLEKNGNPEGMDINMDLYFENWYTQPLTMLFRVSMADFAIHKRFRYYRDMHEIYYLIKVGKCRLMNFDGGVRNVHEGGTFSMVSTNIVQNQTYDIAIELYEVAKDPYVKKFYIETLVWLIGDHATIPNVSRRSLIWKYFRLTGNLKQTIKYSLCSKKN